MTTKKIKITTVTHSIPQDLMIEILLKLPAKSVLRFRSVSKSWGSIIRSQHFIDSFMLLSLSRPRLLLILKNFDGHQGLFFYSSHQSCSFSSSSSMLFAEEKMPEFKSCAVSKCTSVRGFVFYSHLEGFVVCNPITGQFINFANNLDSCCYLGYDPKNNQYKVLRVMPSFGSDIEHSVLTLGGQGSSHSWRPIKANIPDYQFYQNGECIDGVLYYRCRTIQNQQLLCCFDVGSEQLRIIAIPDNLGGRLVNYLGKLAVYHYATNGFILWVLDDFIIQVWSKKTCVFSSFTHRILHFEGTTEFGEVVYVPQALITVSGSFEIFCYDVEKKMERRVKIEGLPKNRGLYPCSLLCSYVDNINYL